MHESQTRYKLLEVLGRIYDAFLPSTLSTYVVAQLQILT
jgi:hypothetical protein